MKKMEKSKYFVNSILVLILITSITLAFENPLVDPESQRSQILTIIDIITTVIFTLEIFVKVIANGLICNGKHSYCSAFWNILDFLVVVISVTSLAMGSENS